MAKKIVSINNNVPPTNYLWLKIGPDGSRRGLYEWNGFQWVKIATGGESSNTITFTDKDGDTYSIINLQEITEGIALVDTDGTTTTKLVSLDYVTQNFLSKDTAITELITWMEDPVTE